MFTSRLLLLLLGASLLVGIASAQKLGASAMTMDVERATPPAPPPVVRTTTRPKEAPKDCGIHTDCDADSYCNPGSTCSLCIDCASSTDGGNEVAECTTWCAGWLEFLAQLERVGLEEDEGYSYGYSSSDLRGTEGGGEGGGEAGNDDGGDGTLVFRNSEDNPLEGSSVTSQSEGGGGGKPPTLTCNRATGEGCSCFEPHCANCMSWGSSRDEQMCLKCRDGRAYMNGKCLKECPQSTWVSDDTLDVGRECLMHAVVVAVTRAPTTLAPAASSRGAPVTTEQAAAVASIGKKELFMFQCTATYEIDASYTDLMSAAFSQYLTRLVGGSGLEVIAVNSAFSRQLTIVVEADRSASKLLGRHINSQQLEYRYTLPDKITSTTLTSVAGSWELVKDASKLHFLSETTGAPQQVASTPSGHLSFTHSVSIANSNAADVDAVDPRVQQTQSNLTVGLASIGFALVIGLGYFVYYRYNRFNSFVVNQNGASYPKIGSLDMDGYGGDYSRQNSGYTENQQRHLQQYAEAHGGRGGGNGSGASRRQSAEYQARLENFVTNGIPLPPPRPTYRSEGGTSSPQRSPRKLRMHGMVSQREEMLLSTALDAIRSPQVAPVYFENRHQDATNESGNHMEYVI